MRSLVAQRLPCVNLPHVRVCSVGAVHHAWRTCTLSPSLPRGVWLHYAASALPPAHGHCRVLPRQGKRYGSSPVPAQETRATRSGLLSAGRIWEQRLPTFGLARPSAMPFWLWGVSATFHPARFTTLQTAVSCVRIGHRTRAVNRVWLAEAALFCAGFSPPWLPTMDARCIVLIPLSTYGSLKEQSLAPFKGAPALSRVQQRRLWLVTMRRRGAALLRRLQALPPTAWHQAGSAIPTRRHPHSR